VTPGVRLATASLHTPFGRRIDQTVAALRAGQLVPRRGLPAFPSLKREGLVGALHPDTFTPSPSGLRAALLHVASEALDGLEGKDPWLVIGTSGVLFLGEYAHEAQEWLGSCGDVADELAGALGLCAPPLTVSTACSSSANALLLAGQALEREERTAVLVVGVEALSPAVMEGFASLMLWDPEGCRPFDRRRSGLHLAEALGAQGLTRLASVAHAHGAILLGGAHVCAAMGPGGLASDAEAMFAVMDQALKTACREPRDVVAIKAHGIGTVDADRAEAQAIQRLYGHVPPITSLKGVLGHTLGASGVVETAAFAACLDAGFIPATVGFVEEDPEFLLRPLKAPIAAQDGCYQLNYFGFGASYVSLVLGWRR